MLVGQVLDLYDVNSFLSGDQCPGGKHGFPEGVRTIGRTDSFQAWTSQAESF